MPAVQSPVLRPASPPSTQPLLHPPLPALRLPAGTEEVAIPLARGQDLLFVPVRIDGAPAGWFLVDTGATNTLVSAEVADRLKLPVRSRAPAPGSAGLANTDMVAFREMAIGPEGRGVTVGPDIAFKTDTAAASGLAGAKIDGILGGALLQELPFTLDWPAATLTFYDRAAFDRRMATAPPGEPLPLGRLPLRTLRTPAVLGRVDGAEGWFAINSGLEAGVTLTAPFAQQRWDLLTGKPQRPGGVAGAGSAAEQLRVRMGEFEFAGRAWRPAPCDVQGGGSSPGPLSLRCAGLIGAGLLRDGRFTFDYVNGRMWAEWLAPEPADAMARRLLDQASPDGRDLRGFTPLMHAASVGRADVAKLLLDGGADPSAESKLGVTALALAAEAGREDVVALLLAKGAKVNAQLAVGGLTPLALAAQDGHLEVVRQLLAAGADVKLAGIGGETVLHRATFTDRADVIDALIAAGADPRTATRAGTTPLILAAHQGKSQSIAALLRGGSSSSEATAEGITPLVAAAAGGWPEAIRVLLEAGADPNARTRRNVTPLMLAAGKNDPECVRLLLARGADRSAVNAEGQTAADVAAGIGNRDAYRLLTADTGASHTPAPAAQPPQP